MNSVNLKQGNWEELVKDIPDKSVDLVFSDLPYASKTFGRCVDCKWDTPIDLDKLWVEIKRIRRDDHVPIFMCCNMKFAVDLINSNKKEFRYDLIWVKSAPCSFLSARKMPMKKHEIVLVFYKHLPHYDLSSHTHKFIKSKKKEYKTDKESLYNFKSNDTYQYVDRKKGESAYDPPLPTSVLDEPTPEIDKLDDETIQKLKEMALIDIHKEETTEKETDVDTDLNIELPVKKDCYSFSERLKNGKLKKSNVSWDPPLPTSVIDIKDNNVYGFDANNMIDDRPSNVRKPVYDPPLPTSVIDIKDGSVNEEYEGIYGGLKTPDYVSNNIERNKLRRKYKKEGKSESAYDPPLPTSVIEDNMEVVNNELNIINHEGIYGKNKLYQFKKRNEAYYDPPLPTSVLEDNIEYNNTIHDNTIYGKIEVKRFKGKNEPYYDPPLPTSVLEDVKKEGVKYTNKEKLEMDAYHHKEGSTLPESIISSRDYNGGRVSYDPPLPVSVIEDEYRDIVLDPPDTLLRIKSQKGKHATQKPTDLMKWVLKYYSKEGDVVFDPTMGSGSTGVACVQMNRKFIGFELDEEIFKVAEQRIMVDKN